MKYIKSLLALAMVVCMGSSAFAANETGTLNLCVGDQVNIYESHGSAYTLKINTQGSSSVATGTLGGSSVTAGKFYTIDAVGVGTTTIAFQSTKGSTTAKRTFTVNVSAKRVIPVNGTADVTGWGSSSEGGSTTWTSTVSPSGYVTVNITSQSKTAMAATLTGKTAGTGTVTISDVSSNAGTECIFAVTVEAAKKTFDFEGNTITVDGATVTTNAPSGDVILSFTKSGSLAMTKAAKADVLVVGGGGSGASARVRSGSSYDYQGNGGGGGEATYEQNAALSAGDYTVSVGAGGQPNASPTSGSTAATGNPGVGSSLSNGGSLSWSAQGGAAGSGGTNGSSQQGPTIKTVTCSIEGSSDKTYGEGGLAGSQTTKGEAGSDGASGEGDGGNGGHHSVGGAGGDGIVVVRLLASKPEEGTDTFNLTQYHTTNITTTASLTSAAVTAGGSSIASATVNGNTATVVASGTTGSATVNLYNGETLIKILKVTVVAQTVPDEGVESMEIGTGHTKTFTTKSDLTDAMLASGGSTYLENPTVDGKTVTIVAKNTVGGPVAVNLYNGSIWVKTLNVTVKEAPTEFTFNGNDYVIYGAEVSDVGDDKLVRFTKNGSMTVTKNSAADILADYLVVGGGGSGEAGRNSSTSDYQGNGGGGAKVVHEEGCKLAGGDYTITVGDGGPKAVASTSYSEGNFKAGTAGVASSLEGPGLSKSAAGGSAGTGGAKGSSSAGTGGDNYASSITGSEVTYGANGKAAGEVATKQTAGQPGTPSTGMGGQGGRGNDSGAGGSGVVIVRLIKSVDYTISFTTAHGETPADMTYTESSEFPLALPSVEAAGYFFVGWTNATYTTPIKAIPELPSPLADIALVAKWLKEIEVPTAVEDLTYNGNEQTGVVAVAEAEYTLTDNTATNAATYKAVATLKDAVNTCWEGGSQSATNIAWSIAQRPITVTPDEGQSKIIGKPYTITYTTNGVMAAGDKFTGALEANDVVGDQLITVGTLAIDDGNDGKNYKMTFVDTVTIAVLAESYVINTDPSGQTQNPITFDTEWLQKTLPDTPAEDIPDALNEKQPNDMTLWENYVLNTDTNEALRVVSSQAVDGVVFDLNSMGVRPDSGATVLGMLTFTDTNGTVTVETKIWPIKITNISESGTYTVTTVISNNTTGVETSETVVNTIGALVKPPYATKAGTVRELVSVPWSDLASEDGDIKLENFLVTANLVKGTKLYSLAGDHYNAWELSEDKKWTPVTTVKIVGGVITEQLAPTPNDATLKCGIGVWVERADASVKLVFVGATTDEQPKFTPTDGWTLGSVRGYEGYNVTNTVEPKEGDSIKVPNANGKPREYTYKTGAWGYDAYEADQKGIVRKVRKTEATDLVLPAGSGFWYNRPESK